MQRFGVGGFKFLPPVRCDDPTASRHGEPYDDRPENYPYRNHYYRPGRRVYCRLQSVGVGLSGMLYDPRQGLLQEGRLYNWPGAGQNSSRENWQIGYYCYQSTARRVAYPDPTSRLAGCRAIAATPRRR